MSRLQPIVVLLLAVSLTARRSCAFRADANGARLCNPAATRSSPRTRILIARSETAAEAKKSPTMTLDFVGEATFASESAPAADGASSLRDFFALPLSPQLLMRGSKGNLVSELVDVDADLRRRYGSMCESVDASAPSPDDRFFEVTTAAVKFPGLRVMSAATIGVKTTGAPESPGYEFVLIRDSTYAEGNRLFVWFFDKVTGKDDGGKEPEQTTRSVNRISVNRADDGTINFASSANLSVRVKFPSFLMKAIPGASREKFEKTGGESLRKALEDDCPASLELFRQEYIRWLEG